MLLVGLTFLLLLRLNVIIMKDYQLNNNNPRSNNGSISKKTIAYVGFVLFGMGIGVGGTYALTNPQVLNRITENPIVNKVDSINQPAIAAMPAPSNFVVDVVKETGPAVVRINAQKTVKTQVPQQFNDPFFQRFFGSQAPHFPDTKVERGTGSGFILTENGQILTNAHVVDGADQVTVTLKDGRTLQGKVMGTDPTTDVAVVKIEADNLPVVKVGNSDRLQVGEWAIAIGNPLGLDNTVTTGIVSASGRSSSEVGIGDKRVEFIQTDAAINPGNSGGPLLNSNGEVIGMNTAIIQNAQGIGFAIPINKAQQIAQQLIATGKAEHAYLGIQMVEVTPELKQQLKEQGGVDLKSDWGVVIMKVMPNSPADLAGIQSGDVIQSINGQEIKTPSEVQAIVEKTSIGSELPLEVSRDDRPVKISIKVGTLPTQKMSRN
jgi:Do/DeqQ family serine protease